MGRDKAFSVMEHVNMDSRLTKLRHTRTELYCHVQSEEDTMEFILRDQRYLQSYLYKPKTSTFLLDNKMQIVNWQGWQSSSPRTLVNKRRI